MESIEIIRVGGIDSHHHSSGNETSRSASMVNLTASSPRLGADRSSAVTAPGNHSPNIGTGRTSRRNTVKATAQDLAAMIQPPPTVGTIPWILHRCGAAAVVMQVSTYL